MIESAILQGLFKLTMYVLAILLGWGTLRVLDNSDFVQQMTGSPYAPVYFGARVLGVFIMAGFIFG